MGVWVLTWVLGVALLEVEVEGVPGVGLTADLFFGVAFCEVALEGVPWVVLVVGAGLAIAALRGVERGAASKLEARLSPSAKETDRLSVAGESLPRMAECSFFVLSITGVCLLTEVKELVTGTLLLGESDSPKEFWVDVASDSCDRSNLTGCLLGGLCVMPSPIPNG